jgi:hypothetical protein
MFQQISALAAIFGSLTAALASSVSTWIRQRHQDLRDLLAKSTPRGLQRFSTDALLLLLRFWMEARPRTEQHSASVLANALTCRGHRNLHSSHGKLSKPLIPRTARLSLHLKTAMLSPALSPEKLISSKSAMNSLCTGRNRSRCVVMCEQPQIPGCSGGNKRLFADMFQMEAETYRSSRGPRKSSNRFSLRSGSAIILCRESRKAPMPFNHFSSWVEKASLRVSE